MFYKDIYDDDGGDVDVDAMLMLMIMMITGYMIIIIMNMM